MPSASSPPPIVRAYLSVSARRARLSTAMQVLYEGMWLGLLDRRALAALDEHFYERASEPVDGRQRTYADDEHTLRGLSDWEREAVETHFPKGGRVVVTAAGAGREVLWLLEHGFEAVGYEPNADLLAAGDRVLRGRGHGGRLRACERDVFPADVRACDAVLVGWGSYMLVPGRRRRVAFLSAARRRLTAGAPLLASFFMRDPTVPQYARVADVANRLRRLRRDELAEPGDRVVGNFVHCFTEDEVGAELAAGGFGRELLRRDPYPHVVARAV